MKGMANNTPTMVAWANSLIVIFILLFAKLAARVIWIAAVMVAGKVQLILAAVEVLRSHVVKVCFV